MLALRESCSACYRSSSSRVPWFVHVLWLLFWIFAVAYVLRYLLPAIKVEFLSPP
jgi:hypothetical protein